ncbi:MAG: HAMP domain-containing histidine kinase [Lachnospiraceae bacterium]|jgi:signal transduction histidine kinase|nr:HAMP domain-containing histidine kinase [Lachnospiraceae bacterium]
MDKIKNISKKNIFIFCTAILIINLALLICFIKYENSMYKSKTNAAISSIISNIKEEYPNTSEEEIIKSLNKSYDIEIGKDVLKQYGINNENAFIQDLETNLSETIIGTSLVLVISFVEILILVQMYIRSRTKKVNKLMKYIEKLSNREYLTNIEESSEEDLNKLKNELYKIAVLLKEDAENAKQKQMALSSSVSDISHQLKTPITSSLILLDDLINSPNMDEGTRKKFLSEIASQIMGMNWLIVSLLKLSRLDAGVIEFLEEKIDLNKLINEILVELEIISEVKNVKVRIGSKSSNIYITGDYNWNKEAIKNIVKNAVEHTKENSNVTITLEENEVYVQIIVTDEGEGIDEEDLKHIFDRFYRAKNSSENSTGIGLALAKNIIKNQNGYISVNSAVGAGTTFIIKYLK